MSDNRTIFKWIIPNYENSKDGEICFKPIILEKHRNITARFTLEVSEQMQMSDKKSNFYLCFYLDVDISEEINSLYLTVTYSILNGLNQKMVTQSIIVEDTDCKEPPSYFLGMIDEEGYMPKFLVDGHLVLLFEVEEGSNVENLQISKRENEAFLNDRKLSDVTLEVGNKKICAIKGILASRSPYFNAMFKANMVESISGKVKIVDVDYEVFIEILRFMYTGKVQKLHSLGLKISRAAHYYQMNDLLDICERSLTVNMDFENAIEILKVADDCQQKKLKNSCILFITQHLTSFEKSFKFKDLLTHPHLSVEIIELLNTMLKSET